MSDLAWARLAFTLSCASLALAAIAIMVALSGCANRDPTMSGVMTLQEVGAIIVLDREFRKCDRHHSSARPVASRQGVSASCSP